MFFYFILGDQHPEAEFNAHMDVEAYNVLIQNATPDKVTVVPFSQIYDSLNIDLVSVWNEINNSQNVYVNI